MTIKETSEKTGRSIDNLRYYAEEGIVRDQNKLDYRVLKPVLFEMPAYEYLRTGDIIGKCMKIREEN